MEKTLKSNDATHGWAAALGTLFKPVAVGVAASLASIVAYVTTPLKEYVNDFFWDEKAELLLISQNSSIKQGDLLNIDIIVLPQAPIAISEGVLKIEYTQATLRPGAESEELLVTTTPKLTASKKVPGNTLEFIADAPGKAEVSAKLITKNGAVFKNSLSFEILPSSGQTYPTTRDFSGKWNIDLAGIHGQMELKDVSRTLNGEYKLSDGQRGQIEGARDGKTFRVTFYRGSSPSRYFIKASFEPNISADLELKGKAELLIPQSDNNDPWKITQEMEFYAVALVE